MTNEECLEITEKAIAYFPATHSSTQMPDYCFPRDFIKAIVKNEEERQAILIMNNALEKQIPKKPTVYNSQCPVCGRYVTIEDNYCGNCGQAIDWRKE